MSESTNVKIAPHSKEAEMMVLGCMLTSPDALNVAAKCLDHNDFYFTEHRIIFRVLKTAYAAGRPSDVHLVSEELRREERLKDVGGVAYISTLAQFAGTSAYVEAYCEDLRKLSRKRQLVDINNALVSDLRADVDEEKIIEKLKSQIQNIEPGPRLSEAALNIKPYTLEDLQRELSETKEGLKTGYASLDEMIRIPNEAITLIGGRPSHGKTTFMLNLFINLIHNYPELCFYFFSYEETRQQIAVKIINILSGWLFEEYKNLIQLEGYLRLGTTSFGMVEKGKKLYQDLVKSGRLLIVGEPYNVQELSVIIATLKARAPVGAIFIDYIQKIKNKQRFGTRQLELADTSNTILETAKNCSIPIVLGAQLGRDKDSRDKVKLDNLREAGDLEQDANLVLGLFNPSMEKAQEAQEQLTDRIVELKVTPLKNRGGIVNKSVTLEFDRPLLKIKDKGNGKK